MTKPLLFEIPRRGAKCALKEEAFQPEMIYYSLLIPEDKGGYQRQDYCEACWQEVKEKAFEQSHIHWKSVVPKKPAGSDLPKKRNERGLILLREALSQEDAEEAFVLSLLLSRARLICLRQELDQGNLYEVLETEEMLLVPRLDLSRLEVESIQARLSKKFNE